MSDDHVLEIIVIGTVKIKMFDGTIHTIEKARHVKTLEESIVFRKNR